MRNASSEAHRKNLAMEKSTAAAKDPLVRQNRPPDDKPAAVATHQRQHLVTGLPKLPAFAFKNDRPTVLGDGSIAKEIHLNLFAANIVQRALRGKVHVGADGKIPPLPQQGKARAANHHIFRKTATQSLCKRLAALEKPRAVDAIQQLPNLRLGGTGRRLPVAQRRFPNRLTIAGYMGFIRMGNILFRVTRKRHVYDT